MVRCNFTIFALLLFASTSVAQLPYGKLDWIYPPGGQIDSQLDVSIGGVDVDIAESITFSHPGIVATQKRTVVTEFEAARPVPNQFRVRIAPGVAPGVYESRALGRFGESTPRAFRVSPNGQVNEAGDNNSPEKAAELVIGRVVNGRVSANASDFYRLTLAKNQRVLIQLDGFSIDSQLDGTLVLFDESGKQLTQSRDYRGRDPLIDFTASADGDYVVQVYDFTFQGGNNHFYRLLASTDPVVEFVFPPAIEPGKTEMLNLYGWNLPNSTRHPDWSIKGRPLESVTMSVTAPVMDALGRAEKPVGAGPDAVEVGGFYERYEGSSFFVAFAHGPVVRDLGTVPGKTAASDIQGVTVPCKVTAPCKVTVPCEVIGQFFPARDDDRYEFTANKGDVYWLEIFSQRHGLKTDPYMLIQRVEAKEDGTESRSDVAEIDDGPKRPGGYAYETASADPVYKLTVPEDGTYRVLVRDLLGQSRARPQNVYRLAIRRARPDFHLLVTPTSPFNPDNGQPMRWSHVLRRGGSIALPIAVVRVDQFNGPIDITLAGLPAGVSAPTATIGPGRKTGVVVVTASETAQLWSGPVQVIGTSVDRGRPVIRTADFATLVWDSPGKNARKATRLAHDLVLQVSDELSPIQVSLGEKRVVTSRGGKLRIPFSIKRRGEIKDKISLSAVELPSGVKAEIQLEDKKDNGELHLTIEPGATPGNYSFCLAGKTKVSYRRLPDRLKVAEGERKSIEAKVAELAAAQTSAANELTNTENALKAQNDLVASASQVLATLNQTTTTPPEKLSAARTAIEAAQQPITEKVAARDAASAASTSAQQQHAAAQEALKRAADRVAKLTENAKPTDRSMYVATNPVTVEIVRDPISLGVPKELTMIHGAEHTLTVKLDRHYGFAEGVRIEPSFDEGSQLTCQAIDVAKDAESGDVVIKSAAETPVGRHTMDLKAKLKFNGFDLEVDRTLNVRVTAPPVEPGAGAKDAAESAKPQK